MFLQFMTVKERASTILTNFQYEEFFLVYCAMPQRRNVFVYNCMYCTHQLMLITMFKYYNLAKEVPDFLCTCVCVTLGLWEPKRIKKKKERIKKYLNKITEDLK